MTDETPAHLELGAGGLLELDELLVSGVTTLEGKLAADFDWMPLRLTFSHAPDGLESLGRPSLAAKEIFCSFLVHDAEIREALSSFSSPLDWSYEQGLLRDPIARDADGKIVWSIDSDTGVLAIVKTGRRYVQNT